MVYTPNKTLTFEEFLNHYGDNPTYELIDGELRNMEPTGSHEIIAGKASGRLFAEILRLHLSWAIPRTCLIKPPATEATALRPDVIVLDEELLPKEPVWQTEPVITLGESIKLVVEVVSTNWQDDYARKVEEYALLNIPEYWIIDFRGLGGIAFIGRPKQPTFTVCQLVDRDYQKQQFRLGEPIQSLLFPDFRFMLDDLL
ncbi:MAG: Uma2 family endonuclease [Cyanobacteria bacterium P01_E01_bin.6]